MGCPVVATDFGGIRDVVRHGENGLLFEDGNISQLVHCLRTALDDRDVRNRLLEGGMKTAYEDFTIENTITGYERFFLDELEGGGVESG